MAREIRSTVGRDVFLDLVRTHEQLVGEFAALFKAHGLTQTQFNVLRILITGPDEGIPSREVGGALLHRVPDVTRLIDRMERDGLVRRERGTADRRVVRVLITDAGRQKCESLYAPVEALHDEQVKHLGEDELLTLRDGLRALRTDRRP